MNLANKAQEQKVGGATYVSKNGMHPKLSYESHPS